MSVPSMVHRSVVGGSLAVRNVASGDADDVSEDADENRRRRHASDEDDGDDDDDDDAGETTTTSCTENSGIAVAKELPDCKVRRNYTCSDCDFFTQNPRQYLYHLRDAHKYKIKVFECSDCLYASKHYQKLLRHKKMVHGGNGGGGGDAKPASRRSRTRSLDVESEEASPPPLVEEQPQQQQQQQLQQLQQHQANQEDDDEDEEDDMSAVIQEDHSDVAVSVFKCSVCAFASRNRVQLNRHEREEHIKTKFFRCSKCTYVTHIKARYTKHVKYHSMPMIKCDMCDFRTPYKWNLDRHCKNHNGRGAFRCSACNFTADIKQSLTVHEMNHHVPPVGQAAGLGVGRRRNKVGASDTTAAEEAANQELAHAEPSAFENEEDHHHHHHVQQRQHRSSTRPKIKITPKKSKTSPTLNGETAVVPSKLASDFVHPDDIVQHSNGKVYLKSKCKLCNFKTAWDSEMAKHEKQFHHINRDVNEKLATRKTPIRPIPNLIPIPNPSMFKLGKEPPMSQKDINDICSRSTNSVLKDFASLFGSEDVFKNPSTSSKVPDLIPTAIFSNHHHNNNNNNKLKRMNFGQKNASFFDRLKEKLQLGTADECNLTCKLCGHESKCLTEHAKHQKSCGREPSKVPNIIPIHNISASRCQYCRQRCKSSADLYNHLQSCREAIRVHSEDTNDTCSEPESELKIDEDRQSLDEDFDDANSKPHPMENKVFVWNDIMVPMDLDVDDSNYEYTEDKMDATDNVSLNLSIRTQSPDVGSDHSGSYLGQDNNNSINANNNNNNNNSNHLSTAALQHQHQHSPVHPATTGAAVAVAGAAVTATSEKIPTHGNDISIAQHKRVFKCPHCTFWASTASRFHVHIVGHLNKKPFECSLCSYRSNWRWDITKHIKLKSVRDQAHESAKVLMTDETGRRNYTKYNKYLTEIPLSSLQSSNETSGGSGTRPRNHHDRTASPSTSGVKEKSSGKLPVGSDFNSLLKLTNLRQNNNRGGGGGGGASDKQFLASVAQERKKSNADSKRTLFKCKKCNFRDASRDILLQHVKGHYPDQQDQQQQQQQLQQHELFQQAVAAAQVTLSTSPLLTGAAAGTAGATVPSSVAGLYASQDLSLRGTSPDRDEASVNNSPATKGGASTNAPFRCGHCNQVSNWKHVIQRHCRLKHKGDIRVISTKNGEEKIEIEEQLDEPDELDQSGASFSAFKCNFCPFAADDDDDFQRHLDGHVPHPDRTHTCNTCNFSVDEESALADHCKLHVASAAAAAAAAAGSESDGKRFRCALCPYVSNSKSQYTYHRQFHRDRGGQYACSHCSYNVSKRHLLHQHLKVHGFNVTPTKANGVGEENGAVLAMGGIDAVDAAQLPDIPLVWVSKGGKFCKMFKCRYCPHVNLRKVNIQEHEKMHSAREKGGKASEMEHRCTECTYVCNNAGVLSSHSKVHQGAYGTVHCLVDYMKPDEEQIAQLTKALGSVAEQQPIDTSEFLEVEMEEVDASSSEETLYFCQECPARFLKETEHAIHKRFHDDDDDDDNGTEFKCAICSYASDNEFYLTSHGMVHTCDYQERTKVLKGFHSVSREYPEPEARPRLDKDGHIVWEVAEPKTTTTTTTITNNNILASCLSRPLKTSCSAVPISGTDLFQQKMSSVAESRRSRADADVARPVAGRSNRSPDPQFGALMHGNPDFVYQTYIKNGRTKEKRYKCHKCPSAFEKREQYKVHLSLHGSRQRYSCETCDYSVKYYANYVQHMKKHKFNDDARATKKGEEDEEDEDAEEDMELEESAPTKSDPVDNMDSRSLRDSESVAKKAFWCAHCPYANGRKDALDNHLKRHECESGVRRAYACEHCDYSVPQAHFLRDHTKLHFIPNKTNAVKDYMICDNLKLTSSNLEASTAFGVAEEEEEEEEERVVFEDDEGNFNNNKGEERSNADVRIGQEVADEAIIANGDLNTNVENDDAGDTTINNNDFEMEVN